jgi:hypothetical protein
MHKVKSTLLASLLFVATLLPTVMYGQDAESSSSFTVRLGQDNFFGFYPSFQGAARMNGNIDFTYYGIFWTIPAFGTPGVGQGLWTEFGVGARFNLMEGQLTVNPQIGTLHGKLLSGADRAVAFDGIVPNLTANLQTDRVEGELYAGLYMGFSHNNSSTTHYAHYWLNAGYRFTGMISAGIHGEVLAVAGGTIRTGDTSTSRSATGVYQWVGPYVQFATKNTTARFSFGDNLLTAGFADPSFYKLSVGYTF